MSPWWKGVHVAQVLSVWQHPEAISGPIGSIPFICLQSVCTFVYCMSGCSGRGNPPLLFFLRFVSFFPIKGAFGEFFPYLNREKEGVICTDWKSPLRRFYNIRLYKWSWLDFTAKIQKPRRNKHTYSNQSTLLTFYCYTVVYWHQCIVVFILLHLQMIYPSSPHSK